MEDGVFICKGKSNPEWNYSAPYGAGRMFSRTKAKEILNADDALRSMEEKGIFTTCVPTDEAREAYKDSGLIISAIEPTAEIVDRIIPIHNIKDN